MRRGLSLFVVLAVAAPLAAVAAQAQAPLPATPTKLALSAKVQDCHTGVTPDQRYAVFVGQMPALAKTKRMAMRFDLYQRVLPAGFQHISVPKFGVWQKSLPGQSGFIIQKRVDELAAPANYRTVVSFRWYDASGKVQRTAQRISLVCKQPDQRPNLTVVRIAGARGAVKGTIAYDIVVRNAGLGDAGPFNVLLTVNGVAQPEQNVAGLAAAAKTDVTVSAPACTSGSTLTVQLDPENQVAESNEIDNTFTRACP
jgi:hypothetical protein